MKRLLVCAIAFLLLAQMIVPAAMAAELVSVEVVAQTQDRIIEVAPGQTVSFEILLSATGNLGADATQQNPSTAKINTRYSIIGSTSSEANSCDPKPFWSSNNHATWTGAPVPYSISATASASADAVPGDYTIQIGTSTTNPSSITQPGQQLRDNTADTLVIRVVAPATPLSVAAPADITKEGNTHGGYSGEIGTAAASGGRTPYAITSNAPSVFPLGTTTVTWTVTDAGGATATDTQLVTVEDTTRPTISAPADRRVEGNTAGGARIEDLGTPTVSDGVDAGPRVTNDAPAVFALGTTTVTWTARDKSGNEATATQRITVVDTTRPSVTAPAAVTIEGNTAGGANVVAADLGMATATDIVDLDVAATSDFVPGFFAVGSTTTVTWTATDETGNSATATQTFRVVDTTKPSVTAPAAVTIEGNTAGGANVVAADLGKATATDIVDPDVAISNDFAPGFFPLGTTTVTWTARDDSGNEATATQTLTVVDTRPPAITAPAARTVEGNTVGGASGVSLGSPTVLDIVDASPDVTNDAPAVFPLGATTVTWTATDHSNNAATATQVITVVDTKPPTVEAPAGITVEGNTIGGASGIDLGKPTVSDIVDPDPSTSNDAPSVFPLGTTTVTWTARDDSGNEATATQKVTVVDTKPPVITAPAAKTIEGNTFGGASGVDLDPPAVKDVVDDGPKVTSNAPSFFPLGSTTVTWTARDKSGNEATAPQTITVVDTKPPLIAVPATLSTTVNAPRSVLTGSASDIVDDHPSLTNNAPAVFPPGQTTVTWTATDASGNTAHETTIVTANYNVAAGFLQPIDMDGNSVFKLGSTVPTKFRLTDYNGNYVSTAIANLKTAKISDNVVGSDVEAISTSAATTGSLFRYDATSNQYIFNLATKSLSKGAYQIKAVLDSGQTITVIISLR